jgi:pyruvate/2-oxoglutarate dehydrogenase complex dihydrolipoamide acyltransferase (E2) component
MATQVVMPQLGESVVEGTVTRWLKQEGDSIQEDEALLEVSTDKVDTEIPSPADGTVLQILVPEGETVQAGTVIALIGAAGETPPAVSDQGSVGQPKAPEVDDAGAGTSAEAVQETVDLPPPAQPVSAGRSPNLGFISPIVARLAQEHNLDLSQVKGTGDGGRITKQDVLAYLKEAQPDEEAPYAEQEDVELAAWETPGEGDLFRPSELMFNKEEPQNKPQAARQKEAPPAAQVSPRQAFPARDTAPPSQVNGGRLIPHTTMRRKIAEHMVASKRSAPHVTTVMEADLQRVIAHTAANKATFAQNGVRLTYTAYFATAAVQALLAYPQVNSTWTDEGILIRPQINLGLAVSLGDEGLIVPNIKSADGLSLVGLARAISSMAERARSKSLRPEDIQDGTFTITNHGITGSLFATPIIHQPQCGILGVGTIQKRVVVTPDDAIAVRPMVYLSFTFDHRILDGAAADGFLTKIIEVLENWPAA